MELFGLARRRPYENWNVQSLVASVDQLASRSDAELLALALAGDEDAFRLLYERLKNGIFRYAFYMSNSRSAAEEVLQEVFISLLREGKNYRPERGDVAGFAFGMARNFVRRIERRERPYSQIPEQQAVEDQLYPLLSRPETISGELIRSETVAQVQSAIASLPDHYRQVVVLCDLCELSYEQAARRLDCAIGTIRSRLSRAHALLAQKLKPLRKPQAAIGTAGTEGCLI